MSGLFLDSGLLCHFWIRMKANICHSAGLTPLSLGLETDTFVRSSHIYLCSQFKNIRYQISLPDLTTRLFHSLGPTAVKAQLLTTEIICSSNFKKSKSKSKVFNTLCVWCELTKHTAYVNTNGWGTKHHLCLVLMKFEEATSLPVFDILKAVKRGPWPGLIDTSVWMLGLVYIISQQVRTTCSDSEP